jgi:hypothetical protein
MRLINILRGSLASRHSNEPPTLQQTHIRTRVSMSERVNESETHLLRELLFARGLFVVSGSDSIRARRKISDDLFLSSYV